jgi:PAS domain S-box-containing protein
MAKTLRAPDQDTVPGEHTSLWSHDLFRLLAEEARDWAVFSVDLQGRVTRWNKGAQRMTGYRANEILGRDFSVLFLPEDIERGNPGRGLRRTARRGRCEQDVCAVRKDRSLFWVKVLTHALRNQAGAVKGYAQVMQDLTRIKGAEEAVQLYMELWENMPMGLLILRPEEQEGPPAFRILAANAGVLPIIGKPGQTVDGLLGMSVTEVLPGLVRELVPPALWAVVRTRETRNLGEIRLRAGQATVFSMRAFPLPNGCVGMLFDGRAI